MTDRFAIYFVKKYVVEKKVKWQIILNPTRCIEKVSVLLAVMYYLVGGDVCSMRRLPVTGEPHQVTLRWAPLQLKVVATIDCV